MCLSIYGLFVQFKISTVIECQNYLDNYIYLYKHSFMKTFKMFFLYLSLVSCPDEPFNCVFKKHKINKIQIQFIFFIHSSRNANRYKIFVFFLTNIFKLTITIEFFLTNFESMPKNISLEI